MLATDGANFYENQDIHSIDTGLGDMSCGEVVEMRYDRQEKSLTICCNGNSYTHTNKKWPNEVYLVFSLAMARYFVRLLPN